MGLSRALAQSTRYIENCQHGEGWWSYSPDGEPAMEPTAWCSLAISDSPPERERALGFLVASQNKDGGWPTAPGAGFSDWVTGPVMLAFRSWVRDNGLEQLQDKYKSSLEQGLLRLLDSRVSFYGPIARLLILLSEGPAGLRFARGWPWDPDCYHWVEPTSYHLLALKVPGFPRAEVTRKIAHFADKFLLDHVCRGGGWNYGNSVSLGAILPPYRVTTAEALLALQDCAQHPAVLQSLDYLQSLSDDDDSSMSLSWSILALDAFGLPFDKELAFLMARQNNNGSFGKNQMVNALACLALQAAKGKNRLRISSAVVDQSDSRANQEQGQGESQS